MIILVWYVKWIKWITLKILLVKLTFCEYFLREVWRRNSKRFEKFTAIIRDCWHFVCFWLFWWQHYDTSISVSEGLSIKTRLPDYCNFWRYVKYLWKGLFVFKTLVFKKASLKVLKNLTLKIAAWKNTAHLHFPAPDYLSCWEMISDR